MNQYGSQNAYSIHQRMFGSSKSLIKTVIGEVAGSLIKADYGTDNYMILKDVEIINTLHGTNATPSFKIEYSSMVCDQSQRVLNDCVRFPIAEINYITKFCNVRFYSDLIKGHMIHPYVAKYTLHNKNVDKRIKLSNESNNVINWEMDDDKSIILPINNIPYKFAKKIIPLNLNRYEITKFRTLDRRGTPWYLNHRLENFEIIAHLQPDSPVFYEYVISKSD